VKNKETKLDLKSPTSIAWWVQVTETPEETKRIVFKKGIPLGSKGTIPTGGHTPPSSIAGASAKCKYPQNIPKKKKHSERIKRIIPTLKPTVTSKLCQPS
jgi:hypothetical protein